MANPDHVAILKKGIRAWNDWRRGETKLEPDLSGIDLVHADLRGVDFSQHTHLDNADLRLARLSDANLHNSFLDSSDLSNACLDGSDLSETSLTAARLENTRFRSCNLRNANFALAFAVGADFSGARGRGVRFFECKLRVADFSKADLEDADFSGSDLEIVNFSEANLTRANFQRALLLNTRFQGAVLDNSWIFGASVWGVRVEGASQKNLIITDSIARHSEIRVDNLELAQFVHLLLTTRSIREVIGTIGTKGVLILGRFGDRIHVLEAISAAVRRRELWPIIFDFEKPVNRDFTETVMILAGMSRFIIADITHPKSVPLELQATVPNFMIPFVPIIQAGERPFSMFADLWTKYRDWVLEPLEYRTVEELVSVLDTAVINPANEMVELLRQRKERPLLTRHAEDYTKS